MNAVLDKCRTHSWTQGSSVTARLTARTDSPPNGPDGQHYEWSYIISLSILESDQVVDTEAWAFIIPLELLDGLGLCGVGFAG